MTSNNTEQPNLLEDVSKNFTPLFCHGKRRGSVAVYLEAWKNDIEEFLLERKDDTHKKLLDTIKEMIINGQPDHISILSNSHGHHVQNKYIETLRNRISKLKREDLESLLTHVIYAYPTEDDKLLIEYGVINDSDWTSAYESVLESLSTQELADKIADIKSE